MRYLKVRWDHKCINNPVELWSEIDDDGWEVRKVEVFSGGRLQRADEHFQDGETFLGSIPMPDISELNDDPQFQAEFVDIAQFAFLWNKAVEKTSQMPSGWRRAPNDP